MVNKEIEINGKIISVFDYEQSKYTSIHTGAGLLAISFRCNIKGEEENKWFLGVIDSEEIKVKLLTKDESLRLFTTKEKSYSYSPRNDGMPIVYSHTISLKEKEKLEVKSINVSELIFEPYEYSEDDHGINRITIRFKCIIDEDKRNKLVALIYDRDVTKLEVTRSGIDKQPRIMRFGRVMWSEIDNTKQYKYKINLVDYIDEEKSFPIAGAIKVSNIAAYLTKNRMIINKLIKILTENKIITEKDVALDMKDNEEWKEFGKLHHSLDNVDDIDKE